MDQKNTIVKCKAHPNCLFNHNGICDNYVINIGADGKCESYVETENEKKRDAFNDIWTVKLKLCERDFKEIERKKNEI